MSYHVEHSASASGPARVSSTLATSARRAAEAGRRFRDPDSGLFWSVAEVDGRTIPGARGPRCLVFQSENAIRRVWCYPEDWRALGDADLTALSWQK